MKKTGFLFSFLTLSGFALQAQNVGIGTTTPTYPLTVISDGTNRGIVQKAGTNEVGFYVSTGGNAYVQTWSPTDLYFTTGNGSAKIAISNATGYVGISTTAPSANLDVNGTFRVRGGSPAAGKVLTSDANGNATWQAPAATTPVGFSAVLSGSVYPISGATTDITGYTESFDDGGAFNPATGLFTAPSDGVYQFTYNVTFSETGTDTKYVTIYIKRSGGTFLAFNSITPGISSNAVSSFTNTFMVKLDQGFTIGLAVNRTAQAGNELRGGTGFANSTFFQGHKLY